MAMDPVSVPAHADVPYAPGVPAVVRTQADWFGRAAPTTQPVVADVMSVVAAFQRAHWGVYDSGGGAVAVFDSVVSVDYRGEARVADYPLEQGAFENFNKVQMPYDVRVKFAVGSVLNEAPIAGLSSGLSRRASFLASMEGAKQSLEFYTVVTPDATYDPVNIIHYDYRRAAQSGVSLLQVDVWMQEIRANVQAQFADQKVNQGTVQPQSSSGVAAPSVANRDTLSMPQMNQQVATVGQMTQPDVFVV